MDHELRRVLAGEAHARPTIDVAAPALVLYEARFHDDGGAAARAHAEAVAAKLGRPAPPRDVDHLLAPLDGGALKWERHGEFSTWTWVLPGQSDPTGPIAAPEAMSAAPGKRFAAVAVFVGRTAPSEEELDRVLGPESPENERAGSLISGGVAGIWTGFRLGPDGWTRFLFADLGANRFRCGRMVRRLLEIETYRIAALFAFPLAKTARREIDALEAQVGAAVAAEDRPEDEVLNQLIDSSRRIERIAQETAFRFGAARAYRALIDQRIEEFRETRIEGLQRLSAYLARRFAPAMDTCVSTEARLETLAKRVERASAMLRTRIDLAMQRQNQAQLISMNENARAQLRLQKAVEGFSVAAISYYGYSLAAKALKPAASAFGWDEGYWFDAVLVVLVVGIVWFVLRELRKKLG